ncbi:hypothetical protein PRIPAC_95429 [Pristionchus pacificus]|uniref:MATH domain-containing protein n=1 Tax=Pristionchus pacificus TaxID=54126 RepID=A0A2A6BC95_PRIPA|nr:hypothetical protein PRIPAC_95429 [Pristionchus pacificus]|eukprot:PDM63474.1 hypothetical protein PRIPAC_53831 [Pristionchus pacificus]
MVGHKRGASTSVEALHNEVNNEEDNGLNGINGHSGVNGVIKRSAPAPVSKQTIRWEVTDVSSIEEGGKNSPVITLMGVKWYLRVRTERSDRTSNETWFSVYVYCKDTNPLDVWYADVVSNIRMVNRRDETKDKKEKFSYRFTHGLTNSGYASFIKQSDMLSPAQGFIFEDKVIIEADIEVLKVHGLNLASTGFHLISDHSLLRPQPIPRTFSAPSPLTDGILVVDGKKLHISKPEFLGLLNVLHDADMPVNPTNCRSLLNLADRFQIKSVLGRVEHFLCTCYGIPDFTLAIRLRLADEFNLFEAQHAILQKLTKVSDITSLKNQRDYVLVSDTTKLLINELHLKLLSKA